MIISRGRDTGTSSRHGRDGKSIRICSCNKQA